MIMSKLALAAALLAVALPATAQTPTAPPIRVEKGHFTMKDGEAIYRNVCQACHMADAMGAKGAGIYPALANNPRLAAAPYVIRAVVLGQVVSIADVVGEIAASAAEQASGLQQVNQAINQMDQVTQQNAAMVEQSTAASQNLAKEAQGLSALVGRFKVRAAGAEAAPTPVHTLQQRVAKTLR